LVQLLLMPDAPPPPTKADRELANAFGPHAERVAALVRYPVVSGSAISPHAQPRRDRPLFATGELPAELIEAIRQMEMDPKHQYLDQRIKDWSP
jgi:hypothetical protein